VLGAQFPLPDPRPSIRIQSGVFVPLPDLGGIEAGLVSGRGRTGRVGRKPRRLAPGLDPSINLTVPTDPTPAGEKAKLILIRSLYSTLGAEVVLPIPPLRVGIPVVFGGLGTPLGHQTLGLSESPRLVYRVKGEAVILGMLDRLTDATELIGFVHRLVDIQNRVGCSIPYPWRAHPAVGRGHADRPLGEGVGRLG